MGSHGKKSPAPGAKSVEQFIALAEEWLKAYNLLSEDKQELILRPGQKETPTVMPQAVEKQGQPCPPSESKQQLPHTPRQQETPANPPPTSKSVINVHRFAQHCATHERVTYEDAYKTILSTVMKAQKQRGARDGSLDTDQPVRVRCRCGRVFHVRL